MAANGDMLGQDQPVILHLLDIEPAKQALQGVKMELMDAAYPLLVGEHFQEAAMREDSYKWVRQCFFVKAGGVSNDPCCCCICW